MKKIKDFKSAKEMKNNKTTYKAISETDEDIIYTRTKYLENREKIDNITIPINLFEQIHQLGARDERKKIKNYYKRAIQEVNTGKKEYRFDALVDYLDKFFKFLNKNKKK